MFESAALGMSYSDKEYKQMEDTLRMRLFQAQQDCRAHNIPVLITIAGVDGAGRSDVANLLSEWMDAKGIRIIRSGCIPTRNARGPKPGATG